MFIKIAIESLKKVDALDFGCVLVWPVLFAGFV